MLQNFAATHNVKMISLSIGGNNFNFASIVQTCVTDWLTSPTWWKDYCNDDSSVTANFTAANIAAQTTAIKNGDPQHPPGDDATPATPTRSTRSSCRTTSRRSPTGSGFRYGESGYTRQNTGGCGFWNNDANWANTTALPTINNAVKNAAAASRACRTSRSSSCSRRSTAAGCARTRSACSRRRA